MYKILVVDDEEHIVELIKFNLEREGFQVLTAHDGVRALDIIRQENPNLIILDVMLPEQDGLSLCRMLRNDELNRSVPIIMLSARVEELDRVLGLEMGADDYVTKPFSPRELVARVKACLRRTGREGEPKQTRQPGGRIVHDRLVIDQDRFMVSVDGKKQDLTPKEFELLRFLAAEPGKVFSREHLLEQIWGYDYVGDSRTVDVHIRHIRQKMEQIPEAPQYIETVRGVGYRFREGS